MKNSKALGAGTARGYLRVESRKSKKGPKLDPGWPAAGRIERRPTARLIPSARNARTHSPAQIGQLAAAIREWGWTMPILIDEANGIIAGHGRVLAAQMLGLEAVPVLVARGWSDAQKRAYLLADNQLALNAGWDQQLLALSLEDLRGAGVDLALIGFSAGELADLIGGGGDSGKVGNLADRFGIPPFSVFDARQGYWQERKRGWLALGIQSELGRGEGDKAIPGGSRWPTTDPKTGRIVRSDSRNRPIEGTEAKRYQVGAKANGEGESTDVRPGPDAG